MRSRQHFLKNKTTAYQAKQTYRLIVLVLALSAITLFTAGCSLLGEPDKPVIPTRGPAPQPFEEVRVSAEENLAKPSTGVPPAVEPECVTLVNAVSQQQLTAYVQTLESFGTRNTFSDTESNDFGIGARPALDLQRIRTGRQRPPPGRLPGLPPQLPGSLYRAAQYRRHPARPKRLSRRDRAHRQL